MAKKLHSKYETIRADRDLALKRVRQCIGHRDTEHPALRGSWSRIIAANMANARLFHRQLMAYLVHNAKVRAR